MATIRQPEKTYHPGRMFIDNTFYIFCPHCQKDFQFLVHQNLKRECMDCHKILLMDNFKYGSDTTYRNICNICKEKKKYKTKMYKPELTYTMMPCGTCLEQGVSIGEATVRVNSKGVWDSEGLHKHQEGIYKKGKASRDDEI